MKKATAILLAGKKGTRFDPDNLKTLHKFDGETLTEKVIKDIKTSNLFDEIILVYNKDEEVAFLEIINHHKILGAQNGSSRFFSALKGIEKSTNEKNVFIDVAAPFYQHRMLADMIEKLRKYDGVMSTILDQRADHVKVKGDEVEKIFGRGEIFRVKSYQAINKTPWINSIREISSETLSSYTEMLRILIDSGIKVGNVISENNPRKLTTKKDLVFFENKS